MKPKCNYFDELKKKVEFFLASSLFTISIAKYPKIMWSISESNWQRYEWQSAPSSHGRNIPSVTQLIIMTIMVSRSNQGFITIVNAQDRGGLACLKHSNDGSTYLKSTD